MKQIVCLVLGVLVAGPAMADILMKNQVVVNGTDAVSVYRKIVDVTKQTPQKDRHGRLGVSASAVVTCKDHGKGDVACILTVENLR